MSFCKKSPLNDICIVSVVLDLSPGTLECEHTQIYFDVLGQRSIRLVENCLSCIVISQKFCHKEISMGEKCSPWALLSFDALINCPGKHLDFWLYFFSNGSCHV